MMEKIFFIQDCSISTHQKGHYKKKKERVDNVSCCEIIIATTKLKFKKLNVPLRKIPPFIFLATTHLFDITMASGSQGVNVPELINALINENKVMVNKTKRYRHM